MLWSLQWVLVRPSTGAAIRLGPRPLEALSSQWGLQAQTWQPATRAVRFPLPHQSAHVCRKTWTSFNSSITISTTSANSSRGTSRSGNGPSARVYCIQSRLAAYPRGGILGKASVSNAPWLCVTTINSTLYICILIPSAGRHPITIHPKPACLGTPCCKTEPYIGHQFSSCQ